MVWSVVEEGCVVFRQTRDQATLCPSQKPPEQCLKRARQLVDGVKTCQLDMFLLTQTAAVSGAKRSG
jgi:hypothetical protein